MKFSKLCLIVIFVFVYCFILIGCDNGSTNDNNSGGSSGSGSSLNGTKWVGQVLIGTITRAFYNDTYTEESSLFNEIHERGTYIISDTKVICTTTWTSSDKYYVGQITNLTFNNSKTTLTDEEGFVYTRQ